MQYLKKKQPFQYSNISLVLWEAYHTHHLTTHANYRLDYDQVAKSLLFEQHSRLLFYDAIPKVVVRRFGAREMAPQGQEVESASTS